MKKYTVKVLEEISPQEYVTTVIRRTDELEVAISVAYENGGYIEEESMKAYDLIRQAIEQNILEGKEYIKNFLGGTQEYLTDLTYREFIEDVYDGDSTSFKSDVEYTVNKMMSETTEELEITDALEAIDGDEIVSYRKILNSVKKEHFK